MTDAPRYCPFYCEENVWQLCVDPRVGSGPREVWVISNLQRTVALAHQRAGEPPLGLVVWDYHVVLASSSDDGWRLWDLDTTMGLNIPADRWLQGTFLPVPEPFRPWFRVLDAPRYRQMLASDRRHMKGPEGAWLQSPPPWPSIGEGHNLDRFTDLATPFEGGVFDLVQLRARLEQDLRH